MFVNFSDCQASLPIVTSYGRLIDYYFTRVNFSNFIFKLSSSLTISFDVIVGTLPYRTKQYRTKVTKFVMKIMFDENFVLKMQGFVPWVCVSLFRIFWLGLGLIYKILAYGWVCVCLICKIWVGLVGHFGSVWLGLGSLARFGSGLVLFSFFHFVIIIPNSLLYQSNVFLWSCGSLHSGSTSILIPN